MFSDVFWRQNMSSSRMEIEYHVKRRDAYLRLADAENQILEALAPPDTQTTVAVKRRPSAF